MIDELAEYEQQMKMTTGMTLMMKKRLPYPLN